MNQPQAEAIAELAANAATILHHKDYFIEAPRRGKEEYEVTLLIRRKVKNRWKPTAVSFTGLTRDEADQKMVDWIETNNAQEADFDAERVASQGRSG